MNTNGNSFAITLSDDEWRITAVALAHSMETAFIEEPDRYDVCQDALTIILDAMEAEGLVKEDTV